MTPFKIRFSAAASRRAERRLNLERARAEVEQMFGLRTFAAQRSVWVIYGAGLRAAVESRLRGLVARGELMRGHGRCEGSVTWMPDWFRGQKRGVPVVVALAGQYRTLPAGVEVNNQAQTPPI